jgi:ABC-type anion transport system duplicated permease subunit
MPSTDTITVVAYLVSFFSPIIVAALKRDTWKPEQVVLLGAVVSTIIYVLIHGLLGALTWPLELSFFIGLITAFGLQQAGYQVYFKDRSRVVEVPIATAATAPTVIVGDVDTVTPNAP